MKTIYILCETGDGEPRYVGATKKRLDLRLGGHVAEVLSDLQPWNACARRQWIRELLDQGRRPEIHAIDESDDPLAERDYIQLYRDQGYRLLNRNAPLEYGGSLAGDAQRERGYKDRYKGTPRGRKEQQR